MASRFRRSTRSRRGGIRINKSEAVGVAVTTTAVLWADRGGRKRTLSPGSEHRVGAVADDFVETFIVRVRVRVSACNFPPTASSRDVVRNVHGGELELWLNTGGSDADWTRRFLERFMF